MNTMDTAPKNGTMLRLAIDHTGVSGACSGGLLEDATKAWTIGFNQFEDTGEDRWQFVGWDWCQDTFVDGAGVPIGWLPWENPVLEATDATA